MRRHAVVIAIAVGVGAGITGATATGAFHTARTATPTSVRAAAGAVSPGATAGLPGSSPPPSTTTTAPHATAPAAPRTTAPITSTTPGSTTRPTTSPTTGASPPPSSRSSSPASPARTRRVGRSAASTSPQAGPLLIAGTYVGRDPRQIDFSVDEGNIVTDLTWTSWSSTGAVGEGKSDDDSCRPNCASAPVALVATTVTLSAPSDGHFTTITEDRGGHTQHFTYPGAWPVGAAQSTPQPTPKSASPTLPAAGGGTGTAGLAFSGVVAGHLDGAVTSCRSGPSGQSEIAVTGTLHGTPWALYLESFVGGGGVWEVRTGQTGGSGGLLGQGYGVVATYPATVVGATQVDWSKGATLDVQLPSRQGQRPAGSVGVQGTVTCG